MPKSAYLKILKSLNLIGLFRFNKLFLKFDKIFNHTFHRTFYIKFKICWFINILSILRINKNDKNDDY